MPRFLFLTGLVTMMVLHSSVSRNFEKFANTNEVGTPEFDKSNDMDENMIGQNIRNSSQGFEKVQAGFKSSHHSFGSSFKILKDFLHTARATRKELDLYQDTHDALRELSDRMSEANLQLFQEVRIEEQDADEKDPGFVPFRSRTLDQCGGNSALSFFNFLTFIVYAFSVLASLITIATGNMANTLSGTFLSGLLNLLGNQGRKRSLRSTREAKDPGRERGQRLDEVLSSFEHDLGSGVMTALLQLSGGLNEASGSCGAPLSTFAHQVMTKESLARFIDF